MCIGKEVDNGDEDTQKKEKIKTTRRAKRKEKADLTRTLKIRVYPNAAQKDLLKQWMGCARLVYNMVVANFRQRHGYVRQYFFRSLLKLKINHTREWAFMKDVPYEVLDHAITYAIRARDGVIKRNKDAEEKGQLTKHQLSFQSKKDERQSITIRAQYCRQPLRFYVSLLHNKVSVRKLWNDIYRLADLI
jgi:transposase